jgi:hypothetical protein
MIGSDLCLVWNWEYDADFVSLLDRACRSQGISLMQITPENLMQHLRSLIDDQISFRAFFDRASDTDPRVMPIVQWARNNAVYRINPYEHATRTWDKATMHQVLTRFCLHTPYTIILPPYEQQPVLGSFDFSPLGDRFTIKPAHGSGGEGVVNNATSLSEVLSARRDYPSDRYLLQAHVISAQLDFRPAWFRVIYCGGKVYPCWWDSRKRFYTPITLTEESRYGLGELRATVVSIARLCKLDLFSTEISLTPDGFFVVVDYVNDVLDLRLQSKTPDGVPDDIVHDIAERLTLLVKSHSPLQQEVLGLTKSRLL